MYYEKCPRCGNEVADVTSYDIVTEQYCEKKECRWFKKFGSVEFYNGETRLVKSDDDYDYDGADEEEQEYIKANNELEEQSQRDLEKVVLQDDDFEYPF